MRFNVHMFLLCFCMCGGRTRLHAGHKSAWYDVALASHHTHQLSLHHVFSRHNSGPHPAPKMLRAPPSAMDELLKIEAKHTHTHTHKHTNTHTHTHTHSCMRRSYPAMSRFHSRRFHVAQTRNMDTHGFLSHTDRATQSTGKDAQEYDDLGAGKRNWLRMLHVEKPRASASHRMAEWQQVRSSAGRRARQATAGGSKGCRAKRSPIRCGE
jgi:hypothetical protein